MKNKTICHSDKLTQMRLVLNDRALSLVHEGYWLVTISCTDTLWFTKLRHRTNGNVVTISANLLNMTFTQKRNGVPVISNQKIL